MYRKYWKGYKLTVFPIKWQKMILQFGATISLYGKMGKGIDKSLLSRIIQRKAGWEKVGVLAHGHNVLASKKSYNMKSISSRL
jgi:hypothetical protein